MGFPGGASGKESLPASARDTRDVGLIPESGKSPGEKNGYPLQHSFFYLPTPVFLPGKVHGQRSRWAAVHGPARVAMTEHTGYTSHLQTLSPSDRFLSFDFLHPFHTRPPLPPTTSGNHQSVLYHDFFRFHIELGSCSICRSLTYST